MCSCRATIAANRRSRRSTGTRRPSMTQAPVFTITYWGVTGTLAASMLPREVTEKLVAAVRHLVEQDRLADLHTGEDLDARIRHRLNELPFYLQSSYGGNTTCVEVQTPDELLILDCGSGLRELGISLTNRWRSTQAREQKHAHILVSHPHIDHICGIPFFAP